MGRDPADLGEPRGDQRRLAERFSAHAQRGAAAQLLDGALGDERAVADHPDAVADLLDLAHEVAREHDRAPA